MAHAKPYAKKLRLCAYFKSNRPLPAWVRLRTKGQFIQKKRRYWRHDKIKNV